MKVTLNYDNSNNCHCDLCAEVRSVNFYSRPFPVNRHKRFCKMLTFSVIFLRWEGWWMEEVTLRN